MLLMQHAATRKEGCVYRNIVELTIQLDTGISLLHGILDLLCPVCKRHASGKGAGYKGRSHASAMVPIRSDCLNKLDNLPYPWPRK